MRAVSAALFVLCVAVVGCDGGVEGEGEGGEGEGEPVPPLAALPPALAPVADAVSDLFARCFLSQQYPGLDIEFVTALDASFVDNVDFHDEFETSFRQFLSTGHATFHEDAVSACVATIESLSCDAASQGFPCPDLLTGDVEEGGACAYFSDCVSQNCVFLEGNCGTCAPPPACRGDDDCEPGEGCGSEGVSAVCMPLATLNAPCGSVHCAGDLVCNVDDVCVQRTPQNGACPGEEGACAIGLTCSYDTETCQPIPGENDSCEFTSGVCGDGLECVNDEQDGYVCLVPVRGAAVDDACDARLFNACGALEFSGLACVEGVCVAVTIAEETEACDGVTTLCHNMFSRVDCLEGTCTARPGIGESCAQRDCDAAVADCGYHDGDVCFAYGEEGDDCDVISCAEGFVEAYDDDDACACVDADSVAQFNTCSM